MVLYLYVAKPCHIHKHTWTIIDGGTHSKGRSKAKRGQIEINRVDISTCYLIYSIHFFRKECNSQHVSQWGKRTLLNKIMTLIQLCIEKMAYIQPIWCLFFYITGPRNLDPNREWECQSLECTGHEYCTCTFTGK